MTSTKNLPIMGAAAALGIGDVLQGETEEQVIERRRKLLAMQQQGPADYGAVNMGAANSLLGGQHA